MCQSQQEALSDAAPSLRTAAFLKWSLSPTFINRFTQIELGILDIRLPPLSAMLSTPCPGSLGQVAGIYLFPLCSFLTALLPRYRQLHQDDLLSPGDHIMMSGLRVVDSTASGKWSFLPRSTSISHPWADCRRFCLTWLGTTGLWPSFTKAMVLSSGFALAGCFFPAPGCLRALPTPCHGATCISPVSMRSYTLTEYAPLFLSCHTTCTVGPPSSPTCANRLGLVRCHTLLGVERIYGRAPAATVHM